MRNRNFAFIDIEATGSNLLKNEIIEIGCVVTTSDLKVIEEFEIKIKPLNIESADPAALKVNHYNPKEWESAGDLKQAMEILASKTKECVMVAQNVAFDSSFIEYAFNKTNVKNEMHYHRLDTYSMAFIKLRNESGIEKFSLRELCKFFGIKNQAAHTGLGDARATYLLYKKLSEL